MAMPLANLIMFTMAFPMARFFAKAPLFAERDSLQRHIDHKRRWCLFIEVQHARCVDDAHLRDIGVFHAEVSLATSASDFGNGSRSAYGKQFQKRSVQFS
jgi:hypothetical protein